MTVARSMMAGVIAGAMALPLAAQASPLLRPTPVSWFFSATAVSAELWNYPSRECQPDCPNVLMQCASGSLRVQLFGPPPAALGAMIAAMPPREPGLLTSPGGDGGEGIDIAIVIDGETFTMLVWRISYSVTKAQWSLEAVDFGGDERAWLGPFGNAGAVTVRVGDAFSVDLANGEEDRARRTAFAEICRRT